MPHCSANASLSASPLQPIVEADVTISMFPEDYGAKKQIACLDATPLAPGQSKHPVCRAANCRIFVPRPQYAPPAWIIYPGKVSGCARPRVCACKCTENMSKEQWMLGGVTFGATHITQTHSIPHKAFTHTHPTRIPCTQIPYASPMHPTRIPHAYTACPTIICITSFCLRFVCLLL